jgi:hypothetical protein
VSGLLMAAAKQQDIPQQALRSCSLSVSRRGGGGGKGVGGVEGAKVREVAQGCC